MYNRFGVTLGVGQMCAGGDGFDSCRGKIGINLAFQTFFVVVFANFLLIRRQWITANVL